MSISRRFRFLLVGILVSTHSILSLSSIPTAAATTTTITSGTWMFRDKYPIFYERCDSASRNNNTTTAIPILLLNGFGMGTFHQHRLMRALQQQQQQQQQQPTSIGTIYAMDYLGQGRSWPRNCNDDGTSADEQGLQYAAATWVEQIMAFCQAHGNKFHLVGNSLGGHLAVAVAGQCHNNNNNNNSQHLQVESLVLINATPVWGGLPLPTAWSGVLPPPLLPRLVGRWLFDIMRHPVTIRQFLEATYCHATVWEGDSSLADQIRAATDRSPGGHAAFSSILWSPSVFGKSSSFGDTLRDNISCPVALLYGQDDPWCQPAIAERLWELLEHTHCRYWQLRHVGHCPHHEAPVATAGLIQLWLQEHKNQKQQQPNDSPSSSWSVQEEWGATVVTEYKGDESSSPWWDQWGARWLVQ